MAISTSFKKKSIKRWERFWMKFAGLSKTGKFASWMAIRFTPPHYDREYLGNIHGNGYISPRATVYHNNLTLGRNTYIDDFCMIYQNKNSGSVDLGDNTRIYRNVIIETGKNAKVTIGDDSSIHPRCQLNAYVADIIIGKHVMIAANCAFYSYDHGIRADTPIRSQEVASKGPIIIDDEAWIGTGVIILSGVQIGKGAIIGAGSVVTKNIPDGGIAVGNPAKLIKSRN